MSEIKKDYEILKKDYEALKVEHMRLLTENNFLREELIYFHNLTEKFVAGGKEE